uniref:Uncharacterized protein n=1 Tax=Arundo donax TaxID=35708 RepID=A0A0A8XMZ0_ARUDO
MQALFVLRQSTHQRRFLGLK